MFLFIFFVSVSAQTCSTNETLTTGYINNYEAHMVTYQKIASDTMFLFIGSKAGQSAFYFDQIGIGPNSTHSWSDLGHLMFLDIQGAGYTVKKNLPKTLSEYSQSYVTAYNTFRPCLKYEYTRLYVVTSGISSKIALNVALILNAYGTILFSPMLDVSENIKELPSAAFHQGLIDYQERQQLELYVLSKKTPQYSDYQYLVNRISKLSGDMLISDFRKFEFDNSSIILTDIMNSNEIRQLYGAGSQFFKNYDIEVFNSLLNALSLPFDLSQYLSKLNIISFIPQYSIATNIQGTLNYFFHYSKFSDQKMQLIQNDQNKTIYAQIGTIYIIQNSGDKSYLDQSQIVKEIIKKQ